MLRRRRAVRLLGPELMHHAPHLRNGLGHLNFGLQIWVMICRCVKNLALGDAEHDGGRVATPREHALHRVFALLDEQHRCRRAVKHELIQLLHVRRICLLTLVAASVAGFSVGAIRRRRGAHWRGCGCLWLSRNVGGDEGGGGGSGSVTGGSRARSRCHGSSHGSGHGSGRGERAHAHADFCIKPPERAGDSGAIEGPVGA
mmetsp:Transcript_53020/g.115704  ORF Transcript_53020/g.115704 Transcript_53020/m.115704 type:complete len:201 (+) Transcript_53020:1540-2142(+)